MYFGPFIFVILLTSGVLNQKSEGDLCVDEHTSETGRCGEFSTCLSAKADVRNNGRLPTFCTFERGSVLVCCRAEKPTPPPSLWQLAPPPVRNTTDIAAHDYNSYTSYLNVHDVAGVISEKKCQEYTEAIQTFAVRRCPEAFLPLIIGTNGEDSQRGEFPHMTAVGWRDLSGGYSFDCGGTLISSRFVLTAAHCTNSPVYNIAPEVVALGTVDLNLDINLYKVSIKHIYMHPQFKSPRHYNDIALLELATDVKFSSSVRPACLSRRNYEDSEGVKAVVTGWGITNSTTGAKPSKLQKVSLYTLDSVSCNESLRQLINRNWKNGFQDTQICAGNPRERKDSCQGDSGSPLQIVSPECIYRVIGITSFGPKVCGYQPAVYTRVSSYLGWIESIVWPDG